MSNNPFEAELLKILGAREQYMGTADVAEMFDMSSDWVLDHAKGVRMPKLEGFKTSKTRWKFSVRDVAKFRDQLKNGGSFR